MRLSRLLPMIVALLSGIAAAQGVTITPNTTILPKTSILKPLSGGGGGTITNVGTGTDPCYPATTCTLSSLSIGDLAIGFCGDNGTLTCTTPSGCSASGTITATDDTTSNNQHTAGQWCIVSGTSITFSRATGAGSDTGVTIGGFHSTTGWNTSTFVQSQAPPPTGLTTTGGSNPRAAAFQNTSPTASSNVIFCYILNEPTGFTFSSINLSFTPGPAATSHADASVYLLNAPAATYAPTLQITASTNLGLAVNCGGMGTN